MISPIRTHVAAAVAYLLILISIASAQISAKPVTPRYAPSRPMPIAEQRAFRELGKAGKALPTWGALFAYMGQFYGFDMIGSDPSQGSATSTIQTVIVPLAMKFPDGNVLDPTQPVQCNGTASALSLVLKSPLFKNVDWKLGGTDVGNTQFLDALQRSEWWNYANGFSPDYHVLLAPLVLPKVTINVPTGQGSTVTGGSCGIYGNVEGLYFDMQLRSLIVKLKLQPNQLPLFLTYDVVEDNGIVGYHSTFNSTIYASAAFNDQNFGPNHAFQDVVPLSQVLGSTFNDPFGANLTPDWMSPFAPQNGCEFLLEAGDPLAGRARAVKVPGNPHQYYVQEMAYELWFARGQSSTSVNGWFSMFNTLKTSAGDCQ